MAEPSLKELRSAFSALGSQTRLRLLSELAGRGAVTVSDLARAVVPSQPLVSWHLSILRRAGLVVMRREGRQVYCSICPDGLDRCRAALDLLSRGGTLGRGTVAVVVSNRGSDEPETPVPARPGARRRPGGPGPPTLE
jgi:DNA-binding transcriptional ArsR family regulator